MQRTFYMMRHGETLFNKRNKIQGSCDSPLTKTGIAQAKAARPILDDINFTHFYSSTSERASDTLEIVTRNKFSYQRLKGLKEMDFGVFEGESEDLNPPSSLFETFFVDFGGESRDMVGDRLKETALDIMRQEDHHHVLAVSHAGACLHFLRQWAPNDIVQAELEKGFSNSIILKYNYHEEGRFEFIEAYRPGEFNE